MKPESPLLEVTGLEVHFSGVPCVRGVSFSLEPGATLGIVGESGSGKSLSTLALLGLLPGAQVRGQAHFQGEDLLALEPSSQRRLRGRRISMIFQDPMTSLNPSHTLGEQLMEGMRLHLGLSRAQARLRAVDWLAQMGIPAPETRLGQYPFEVSGGLRQRVLIAMALSCGPDLLIADEPTTALDMTVQAQILDLLEEQQRKRGMALILISHDLPMVAQVCEGLQVMYAGLAVESGPTRALLEQPRHPYTAGLLTSASFGGPPRGKLQEIPGQVPDPRHPMAGCPFHDRCAYSTERCQRERPPLEGPGDRRWACHFPLGAP